ncbi:MAG TPA: cation diffusion facilitator family transporter [Candidatus Saccharimonadales bacterium]|nr:cation diffusion facilitator family transporter [Candidatus Saccharimonadales bacterium]
MQSKEHSHTKEHSHDKEHGHTHGVIDPSLTSGKGLWAVKWSSIVLFFGALFQLIVVLLSGSVSLLSDTIHNFGDAATAIPLGTAFVLGRRKANKKFTYGYGRVEDIAGIIIVVFMLVSVVYTLYISVNRIFHPQTVSHLWVVALASLVGFAINEGAAIFRIRIGNQIHSQALIADGYHARTDGWSSLAVLLGAIGVWLGFPLADPLVGILISIVILKTTWESAKEVFARVLDGIDPKVIDEIKHIASHVKGVEEVTETRVRWIGHKIHAELNVAVDPKLSVEQGHDIASNISHDLLHELPYISNASIHVDPLHISGEKHHAFNK